MKRFLLLAAVLIVGSCGGGSKAPRNLDNACLLAREKPSYYSAMRRTEARWGIPVHVQMATIHQESRFVANAKTPHRYALGVIPIGRQSSAKGFSQALDGTWEEYQRDTRRYGARRTKIQDATDFMGWYMDGSSERLGISKYDARAQYLAYHEGRAGYARGSYRGKSWLMAVADRVQARADMYRAQLSRCGR
ncbi:lytic transglycosylase [Rhodobacter sp. TJ_12]|uniref:transglycosylase SLT domain-containing protein n=1 Tax=Rhodobacter sp. TJ_12 TaxID=2029399 RepID=UPI001CBD97AC|nr:lytic transglycosylase [Rhodobacter sp. TJ_12]MBZ4020998.1 lytic transglycosylase [Rhodobacter sp. TJ_12]